jgi:hypothetical protein
LNENKLKLLTIIFGIAVVRVSQLIATHIVGIDISLMKAVVEHREVSLDVVDGISTTILDGHGMNLLLKCSD